MGQENEAGLKVRLFGGFEVWRAGELLSPETWPQRKTESLLKLLLTERGRVFTQDQLIEALFPDLDVKKAAQNLYRRISELRHILEPDIKKGAQSQYILRTGLGGYCFSGKTPCWLDTEEFQKHCEAARELADTDRWLQAHERYQEALVLYRGDFLAEDLYEEWSLGPREHWRELYLQALSQLAECHARLKKYPQAIECCQRILTLEPSHESAYRQKMLYQSYAGQSEEALTTYQQCVKTLQSELEVEPAEETKQLHDLILRGKLPRPPQAIPHNLPQRLTHFFGREEELTQIAKQLQNSSCRLLTLVGPGGIGKTRLALEAAAQQMEEFPQGVFFVSLASISSPDLLASALADALRFSFHGREDPKQQLFNYLREKKLLCLLDNFEHLVEAAAQLREILQSAPQVKLLVTSRARLNLQEEWVLDIEGLSFPRDETKDGLDGYSAAQLFLESARRVKADFSPSADERRSVTRICQLVEGMPLGLELAAAWARVLSCQEIAQEMQRNRDFLAATLRDVPERHRSIRAVFEHSWNLLEEGEREGFRRLSAFRGGFQREAAERVTDASLHLLSSLVDKSLLRHTHLGRYELHELMRQYSEEKLRENAQEMTNVHNQHCTYYAEYLHQRESHLKGHQQSQALNEISAEMENIHAACNWASEHGRNEELAKILESLFLYYILRGSVYEGAQLLGRMIHRFQQAIQGGQASVAGAELILARARARQARLLESAYQCTEAKDLLQQSLGTFRALEDQAEAAFCFNTLGGISEKLGEYEEAKRFYEGSLGIREKLVDSWGIAISMNSLANVAVAQGDYRKAKKYCEESLTIRRAINDAIGISIVLNNLGGILYRLGKLEEAKSILAESLALRREIDDPWSVAIALNNLGEVSTALKEYAEAEQYLQEGLTIRRELGDQRWLPSSLKNLGHIARLLGKFDKAQQYLEEAMHRAMDLQAPPLMLDILLCTSELLAAQGKSERAVEISTMSLHHPASSKEVLDRTKELLDALKSKVPPKIFAASQKRGKARALDEVVTEILQDKTDQPPK